MDLNNIITGGWNGSWAGAAYNASNPMAITDLINHIDGRASFFTQTIPFTSGYVNLQPIRNIYMSITNLGTFKTIGPMGESTIIKKVPVTAGDNEMIFAGVTSAGDYLDCSKQTLKTIHFELKDVHGNVINLHGSHVSFSIVFDKYKEIVA